MSDADLTAGLRDLLENSGDPRGLISWAVSQLDTLTAERDAAMARIAMLEQAAPYHQEPYQLGFQEGALAAMNEINRLQHAINDRNNELEDRQQRVDALEVVLTEIRRRI